MRDELSSLYQANEKGALPSREVDVMNKLDETLRLAPVNEQNWKPTKIGNILSAAEERSLSKYGLDAVVCFPRIFPLLSADERQSLQIKYDALLSSVNSMLWCVLGILFVEATWWALPISAGLACAVYYGWVLNRAAEFGDALETAFDLRRKDLYKTLRWPLPKNPEKEYEAGQQVSSYLWRGSRDNQPTFTDD